MEERGEVVMQKQSPKELRVLSWLRIFMVMTSWGSGLGQVGGERMTQRIQDKWILCHCGILMGWMPLALLYS